MPHASVNGLELAYERQGDPGATQILLCAGLGVQLIDWPDHFVDPLVDAGYGVIRFDNRDIGLSSRIDGGFAEPMNLIEAALAGESLEDKVAYTLVDMADDAAGLLDELGVDRAHVLGGSMGGMIAQSFAIAHPERTRSLTSIMSTTGNPEVGQPTPEAMEAILSVPPADDRDSRIAHGLTVGRVWGSPEHFDETALRKLLEASYDRVGGPQSIETSRQLCAILASPPRDEMLGRLNVPTLVIHGAADPLIPVSGGEHTAACVPGAQLVTVEGMAHDLLPPFMAQIHEPLLALLAAADAD